MVAEWSKLPYFKFKLRQTLRSQVSISLEACLYGTIMDPLCSANGIYVDFSELGLLTSHNNPSGLTSSVVKEVLKVLM